ncbi:MAG: Abi-alpha family protein, partial [Bacteroidota bacterium]|nr:Abi-alpha family protein [Bacteroidota bacterium]
SIYQKIVNPVIALKGEGKFIPGATPEWYAGWTIEGYSEFDVSASMVRLSKFGLIELMFDRTAGKDGYENLMQTQFLQSILHRYKLLNPTIELEIEGMKSIVYVNEYGLQFKNACK